MKIRLTREFRFEMAHALDGYDGACSQLHGHSYKLFVTVRGEPCNDVDNPKYGMVIDFSIFKSIVEKTIVDKFDHALAMRDSEENRDFISILKSKWERIILLPYQPTCENMLIDFVDTLKTALPTTVELVEIKLYETARSSATWKIEDNQ